MPDNDTSRAIRRFFKTPKGIVTVILVILMGIALPGEGVSALPGILGSVIAAGLVDLIILRMRRVGWDFPSGAVVTALIVSMVVRSQEPWYVPTMISVLAVLSKYLLRSRAANVFNPAAIAIVAMFYVFHMGQSWWGALPEMSPYLQVTLIAGGLFITDRVNKMPMVLMFLGIYFLLFTIASFVGSPVHVAEIYRAPDLQAVLYFAFIILTDPPTSPVKYPDQLIFAVIVAVVSFAAFEWIGSVYFLLAGVLVGNVWEAWRRVSRRTNCTFPRGIGAFARELSPWRVPS